jgi:riboflavin biosynthesis pyrimidine reductase
MIEATFGLAKEDSVADIQSLARSYGPWSGIRSNHVIDDQGRFFGGDGSSRSITTEDDKALMLALRAMADLIVVDAATARKEGYKSPSSAAKLAIFSKTGNFDQIPAVSSATSETFLFSPNPDATPTGSNLSAVLSIEDPFDGFVAWTKAAGFSSVLLEAGPTLTEMAFARGVVSESAITLVPARIDLSPSNAVHPFDSNGELISIAHTLGASFTLWKL